MFEPTCDDAQPHPDVVGDGDVVLVHAGALLAQLTGHIWAGTDTGSYCWALTGADWTLGRGVFYCGPVGPVPTPGGGHAPASCSPLVLVMITAAWSPVTLQHCDCRYLKQMTRHVRCYRSCGVTVLLFNTTLRSVTEQSRAAAAQHYGLFNLHLKISFFKKDNTPVSKVDNECVGKGTAYNARNSRDELSPPASGPGWPNNIYYPLTLLTLPTLSSLFSVSTLDNMYASIISIITFIPFILH